MVSAAVLAVSAVSAVSAGRFYFPASSLATTSDCFVDLDCEYVSMDKMMLRSIRAMQMREKLFDIWSCL